MPFKSNIIDEELYSIWSMFIENHKTNDILDMLNKNFNKLINPKTVYNWRIKFKELTKIWEIKDAPVVWDNYENFEKIMVPISLLPKFREMYFSLNQSLGELIDNPPTYRETKWLVYVQTFAPEITSPLDILFLAHRFIVRDVLSDFLQIKIDRADIDAQLNYKPWISPEREALYLNDIKDFKIPAIKNPNISMISNKNEYYRFNKNFHTLLFGYITIMATSKAHLLFTEQSKYLKQEKPDLWILDFFTEKFNSIEQKKITQSKLFNL